MKDYIKLSRPFTLLAPLVGFVSGAVVANSVEHGGGALPVAVWLGAAGGVLLNAFSNGLNQIHDIEIDRINCPQRPLPAARLTLTQAGVFSSVCLLAAMVLAAVVGLELLAVFGAAAAATYLYSAPPARIKKRGLLGNLIIAFGRGVLIMVAGWASVASLAHVTPWAAGAVLGLFVFGAATTKDFADVKGDAAHGVRTLPVMYGPAKAARIAAPFLVVPFLLVPALVYAGALDRAALPVTALALYGMCVAVAMIRHYATDTSDSSRAVWFHMYILLMLAQAGLAACYWVWY